MSATLELHRRILALERWVERTGTFPDLGIYQRRDYLAIAIDTVAKQFPEIVGIRHNIGTDATGADSLHVRVLLTDEAVADRDSLGSVASRISDSLTEAIIRRDGWPLQIYVNFRSASEQATTKDPDWEPHQDDADEFSKERLKQLVSKLKSPTSTLQECLDLIPDAALISYNPGGHLPSRSVTIGELRRAVSRSDDIFTARDASPEAPPSPKPDKPRQGRKGNSE